MRVDPGSTLTHGKTNRFQLMQRKKGVTQAERMEEKQLEQTAK